LYATYGALLALSLAFLGSATPALADAPLSATCIANPSNAIVGDNVNWQVQGVNGGNGTYIYAWSGTDNLIGNNQTVYKTYTYPGTKIANVTITSGGQAFTATCSLNVAASNGYNYNNGYNNNYPYGYTSTYNQPTQFLSNGYYYQGVFYPYNNNNGYNYNQYGNAPYNPNIACGGSYVNGVYYNSCGSGYNNGYNGYNNYNGYNSNGGFVPTGGYNGYNNGYNGYGTYTNPPINGSTQSYGTTYTGTTSGTPVAGVFLSQVPATGIDAKNLKMILFVVGLFAWSLFAAYIISFKKKNALATSNGSISDQSSRIEAFKQRNLEKKNGLK
jgi:hypothetical protein